MMLVLEAIHTYYDQSHVLNGISLTVKEGEVVCLLGRNGAGKSTTLKSVMGITPPRSGTVKFKSVNLAGFKTFEIAKMGIGYVPEDRRIFPNLTVLDNLEMGIQKRTAAEWTLEKIFHTFPVLERLQQQKGSSISGGEQQMLTIARTLMGNPEIILLDEPSEGLAPIIVQELGRLMKELKNRITILLAEQNATFALKFSDMGYIIDKGKLWFQGTVDEIKHDEEIKSRFLAV